MATAAARRRQKKRKLPTQKSVQKAPNSAAKKSAADWQKARVTGACVAYKELKEANKGRLQHHQREEFLKQWPGITLGMLNGHYYRRENALNGKNKRQSAGTTSSGAAEPEPMNVEETDATTTTEEEGDSVPEEEAGGDDTMEDDDDVPPLIPRQDVVEEEEDEEEDDNDDDDDDVPPLIGRFEEPVTKASTKCGRPKGSTKAAKAELRRKKEDVANRVAHAFKAFRDGKDESVTHKEKFKQIVAAVCKEVGISVEDADCKYETIRKRLLRGKPTVTGFGQESPLATLEKILVDFIVDMEALGDPLSPLDVCGLAMELIEGTCFEQHLLEFQKSRKMVDSDATKPIPLTSGWYQSFMARNADLIASKKPQNFDRMRTNWGTRRNFEIWYSLFYPEMVESNIFRELPEEVWLNSDGDIVETEAEAVGMKTKFQAIKEHRCMYVMLDEMGLNTNMKNDGSIGSERRAGAVGVRSKITCSMADHRFTLIPVLLATGELLTMACIFQGDHAEGDVAVATALGFDHTVEIVGEDEDSAQWLADNCGRGKAFCGFPVMKVQGLDVPSFVCATPHAGIDDPTLVKLFEHMDIYYMNFMRPKFPDVTATALVDGHWTRFSSIFQQYCIDPAHRWNPKQGLPYATDFWQAGDSPEVNGNTKTEVIKEKRILLRCKKRLGMPVSLKATDIPVLVSKAAYANYEGEEQCKRKQHAMQVRGLLNPTYDLLLNKELLATEQCYKSNGSASAGSSSEADEVDTGIETSGTAETSGLDAEDLTSIVKDLMPEQQGVLWPTSEEQLELLLKKAVE